jgi:hypothetical protein
VTEGVWYARDLWSEGHTFFLFEQLLGKGIL